MNPISQSFTHEVPAMLLRFPKLIRWVHRLQTFLYYRNRVIRKAILPLIHNAENLWDAGCGDGHYSLLALRRGNTKVISNDLSRGWINFLTTLKEQKLSAIEAEIEEFKGQEPFDLIACLSVLHYVKRKKLALKNLVSQLKTDGKIVIYVPVKEKTVTPIYRWMFKTHIHYENQQSFREIITASEWKGLFKEQSLVIRKEIYCYGNFGRLGHEIWSITHMCLSSHRLHQILIGILIFTPAVLFSQMCYLCESWSKPSEGNGVLWILGKQA